MHCLKYAIIDIETTGGNSKTGKITEIAVFLHNGHKVVDQYETLVNPGVTIPPYITKLTGISDEMVADAPAFGEIADKLDRFTANAIFVAHNAHFDYGFVREEFRRVGKDFKRKKLCTVQLSRHAFPGLASYSLDKITSELQIKLNGHHRAAADAEATAMLFGRILEASSEPGLFDAHHGMPALDGVHSAYIDQDFLRTIPDDPGIARFYSAEDELLYTKRSANVLTTICEKLKQTQTEDAKRFRQALHRIDYQLTGSQLVGQLLEVNDVMQFKPEFNHGRFSLKAHYACIVEMIDDVPHMLLTKRQKDTDALLVFANFYEGKAHLENLAKEWGIPLKDVRLGRRPFPALPMTDERALARGVSSMRGKVVLTDEGRNVSEHTRIYLDSGSVMGYGYYDNGDPLSEFDLDRIQEVFTPYAELELVARKFVEKGRYESLIQF